MLTCNLKAFQLPNLPVENVGKQFYSKGSENFDPSHLAKNWAKNHLWRVKLFSIGVSTYSDSAKLGFKTPKLWYFKQFGDITILKGLCPNSLSNFESLKDVFKFMETKIIVQFVLQP